MKKVRKIIEILMLFVTASALTALARFAGPFASETSRLRQLDGVLLPVLTAVCAIGTFVMLLVAFLKKTTGRYAPFGLTIWGMTLLLYSLITPYRVMKILYAPDLQKLMLRVDLHVDVTTIQSVKTIAEALNLVAGAACVLLGAAVVVSLIRRYCVRSNSLGGLSACIAVWAGLTAGYAAFGPIAQRWGYGVLFGAVALLAVAVGAASLPLVRERETASGETVQ